ncbi:MAG TPA: hypothetical protein VGM69_09155 [Chloroflexota bacterium]
MVFLLALVAGCTDPPVSAIGRPRTADPAGFVAPRAVVVSNGQIAIGTPVTTGPAATPPPQPTQAPPAFGGASPSAPSPSDRPGQSAAARKLSQAAPDVGQRNTRGTLALPDPTRTAGPTAVARTPAQAGAATPSPSPSPVPTLRPAHPPARYPRLTTHGDHIILRDREPDPAGFYRDDSLTPVPPGLSPPPDGLSDPLAGQPPLDTGAATP